MIDPNEHDQFLLRQRWAPVINRYEFRRGDRERTLDRRLVVATAVGMDALQARQARAPAAFEPRQLQQKRGPGALRGTLRTFAS